MPTKKATTENLRRKYRMKRKNRDRKKVRKMKRSLKYSDSGPHVNWKSYTWHQHEVFDKFWREYSAIMNGNIFQHAAYGDGGMSCYMPPLPPCHKKTKEHKRYSKKEKMENIELTKQMKTGMSLNEGVNEDFLDFMEKSLRHKKEWRELREGSASEREEELKRGVLTGTVEEHPDSVRCREMKELYGKTSSSIHAMETSVQLSFDRISTRKHPKLWPNIPLNIAYS